MNPTILEVIANSPFFTCCFTYFRRQSIQSMGGEIPRRLHTREFTPSFG